MTGCTHQSEILVESAFRVRYNSGIAPRLESLCTPFNHIHNLTPEDYLAFNRQSDERYEYYDGQIVAMSGSIYEHGFIVEDMFIDSGTQFRGTLCTPYIASMQVRVTVSKYTYPDLTVVCGKPEYMDTITNPITIVEVLLLIPIWGDFSA